MTKKLKLNKNKLANLTGDLGDLNLGSLDDLDMKIDTPKFESHLVDLSEKTQVEEKTEVREHALYESMKAASKRESEMLDQAMETEFWFCVSFASEAHKVEFLERTGLIALGDKYLNGHTVAELMDVPLKTPIKTKLKPFKKLKDWESLVE